MVVTGAMRWMVRVVVMVMMTIMAMFVIMLMIMVTAMHGGSQYATGLLMIFLWLPSLP